MRVLLPYLFAAAVIAVVLLGLLRKLRIREFESGLLYANGRFKRLLKPGAHWMLRGRSEVVTLDMRKQLLTVPGQEIITKDNAALKLSFVAEYEIGDPVKACHTVADYSQSLYLSIQLLARKAVSSRDVDDVLASRSTIGAEMLPGVATEAETFGLKVHSLEAKDVMFPGALRDIFNETVRAKKAGLAALERARGETATLRSLANAAKMMQQNPALLNLRALQTMAQAAEHPGNTFVFGVPPTTETVAPSRPAPARTPPEND